MFFRRPYQPTARRFEIEKRTALDAATAIVPAVLDLVPARSVIDVGCGKGLWLSVFAERGVARVVGIDGDYLDRSRLAIDPASFIAWDLNQPLGRLQLGRFDLALSLEVGEHLLPSRADSLVDDLCGLADVVLYGAAIPKQAGEHHVNEQWQSFWVAKFAGRGFLAYDVLRPKIWGAANVPYWYKQNTIFYVKSGSPAHENFARHFPAPSSSMFDVIHPDLYWQRIHAKRGLRRLAKNGARLLSPLLGRSLLPSRRHLSGDEALIARQRDGA
jgi:SAM-dependent methyltransferase